MRWDKIKIKSYELVDVDELGNNKKRLKSTRLGLARVTEWTNEDVELYGREFTQSNRKIITKDKFILGDEKIEFDSNVYDIVMMKKYDRYTVIFLSKVRVKEAVRRKG